MSTQLAPSIARYSCAVIGLLLTTLPAAAEISEVRDYAVYVAGKHVGYSQLIITDRDDGSTVVTNRAHAEVNFIFGINFTFSYQGSELWKDYRLKWLNGVGKESNKTYKVSGEYDPRRRMFRLIVNGRESYIPEDVWTSVFWRLPKVKQRVQAVKVLKTAHGTIEEGQLQYVGSVEMDVAGKKQTCYHFRIVGAKKTINAWFDAQHRLVRNEFVETGRQVSIVLTNIRRTRPKAKSQRPANGR